MEPEGADPDYGWIVPGLAGAAHTHAVERFVEKPEALETARLATSGALINAFIVAARAGTLRERMRHSLPEIFRSDGRSVSGDFSRDFLERDVSHVRVLRAPRCGWTDLGTPVRLRRWLQRAASVSRSHPERERRHVA
jgi:mannose-1-phosphate guanylyltransferase